MDDMTKKTKVKESRYVNVVLLIFFGVKKVYDNDLSRAG